MKKIFKTIVGGRSATYQSPDGFPRGIEILLKKAKVDPEFRDFLLQDPVAAAQGIGLDISDNEKRILENTPRDTIGKMVETTFVPKQHVSTFLNAKTAAMLSLVLTSSVIMPFYANSGGVSASERVMVEPPETMAELAEQRLRNVQEALEQFKADTGFYPSTAAWLKGNPLAAYINPSHLYDPWYRKFHYKGVKDENGHVANYWLESLGKYEVSQSDNIHSPIDSEAHTFSGKNPLTILYPRADERIILTVSRAPMSLKVEHAADGGKLEWYLDERKIGSTVDEYSLGFPVGIKAGGHWLTVIDENENYSSVSFTVEREYKELMSRPEKPTGVANTHDKETRLRDRGKKGNLRQTFS